MIKTISDTFMTFWIEDIGVGNLKRIILHLLQKINGFADWHLSPINERPYAREIVRYIQKYFEQNYKPVIVELGCGLGSIIGNVKSYRKRIGIDVDVKSVRMARILHPFVHFINGSFDDVKLEKIDCLIMVNFIHAIPEEELAEKMRAILARTQIKLIVIDTFKRNHGTPYLYSHKGEYLFDGKYKLHRRSHGYEASCGTRRYIEYWEKI